MVQFWLDSPIELFNLDNFRFSDTTSVLNVISLFVIIITLVLTLKKKKAYYFGIGIIILSIIIIINYNMTKSGFQATDDYNQMKQMNQVNSNGNGIIQQNKATVFSSSIFLTEDSDINDNVLYVTNTDNIYPGDIIEISDSNNNQVNIVSNVYDSLTLVLRNDLKYSFLKGTKVSILKSIAPQIVTQADPLLSIEKSRQFVPPVITESDTTPNTLEKTDYNLGYDKHILQGPPHGNLYCRAPSINNPMGVLNINDYGESPTMYGTCNINNNNVENTMQDIYESGVSQRVSDLVFHRGNSQNRFTPMAVDTLPNAQEEFAYFCYQNPSNIINPKYASIFVNEPDKFKYVASLAKATGTENGG